MQLMNLRKNERNEKNFKKSSINMKLELQDKFEKSGREIDSK